MIAILIQSSVILSAALTAVLLLRRQSAATRHATLTAGLISSLVVPFVGGFLPAIPFTPSKNIFYVRAQVQTEALWSSDTDINTSAASTKTSQTGPRHLFLWLWLGGTVVAGVVLTAGIVKLALMAVRSRPLVRGRWIDTLSDILGSERLRRQVRLLQTGNRSVLGTNGFLSPRIFLPSDAAEWSDDRIRIVLTHELAHIKRFDWPVQVLAEVARAAYWFNPLYWIACRWLRSESELACDDFVLNSGIDARDYAAHLLEFARILNYPPQPAPLLAMSRPPHLERRFIAMLNPLLNHRSVTRRARLAIWVMAVSIGLPLAVVRAKELPPPSSAVTAPVVLTTPAPKPPPATAAPSKSKRTAAKPASAQGRADGILTGTVSDATGAVVPGVAVTVSGGQVEFQTVTDQVGRYQFATLPPGLYSVSAQLPGFSNAPVGRIQVQSSQTSIQNLTLAVGAIAQKVTVSVAGQPKPKPAPLPGTPQRIRVGGNVQAATLISQVRPVYPDRARDAGIEGIVRLQGFIGVDGAPIGLHVVKTIDPDLTTAALEAVKRWRYRPALLNNEPIDVQTEIEVEFKLDK
jgi:TonB family protein